MQAAENVKVLVVDDDARLCESIRSMLRFRGYDAHSRMNLFDALNALVAAAYDLVLLDLKLEDQNGFVVMDYLGVRGLPTQVIVITGQHGEGRAITALRKGAADYLRKPVEPDDLLRSVERVRRRQERRRDEATLNASIKASRERFRQVVDSQPDRLFRLNRDYKITFANKAFADTFAATPRQMIGRAYKTLVKETTRQTLFDALETVQPGATPFHIAYQRRTVKGRHRYEQWQYQGVRDEQGKVVEIQCIGRDVTREKRLHRQIERKKEKFRDLAERTSDWIWEVDRHGVYTYASPVVFDLLGYRPEEVVGKRPFDFMPPEEARRVEGVFTKIMATGKPLNAIENVNLHKDGSPITLETSGVPIRDDTGSIIGYRGVDRDITVRRMIESNLSAPRPSHDNHSSDGSQTEHLLSICAACKRVRDRDDRWGDLETYFENRFDVHFTHGICPRCAKRLYPELYEDSGSA